MYKPEAFAEDRSDVLSTAMADIQLACLVTPTAGDMAITHVPMVIKTDGDRVVLETHVARANPHWQSTGPTVAIFQGPHAYVSPSYYPSKQEHGKVVPTWAYIAVHAHGVLSAHTDEAWLQQHLNELTDANETRRPVPWKVADAPAPFTKSLSRGIVGLRLTVDRLEGTWKINQNKTEPDQLGTHAGLQAAGGAAADLADALADLRAAR